MSNVGDAVTRASEEDTVMEWDKDPNNICDCGMPSGYHEGDCMLVLLEGNPWK